MGVEFRCKIGEGEGESLREICAAPVVLGLQPAALVDHVARVDLSFLSLIPGECGGSFPIEAEELTRILDTINAYVVPTPEIPSPVKTIAGGSVTNTIRGLAAGFGISCGMIGAYGNDQQGKLFTNNMSFHKVDISRLRLKNGHTAQCVCMVDECGNRTMRPCLSSAVKVQADELKIEDFKGSKWLVLRYAIQNLDVLNVAIRIAKQEGLSISLDLASFEMVRKFRLPLIQLLESGNIDLCFANEDEAKELLSGEDRRDPEAALRFLAQHCRWAVVTLGQNGCIAKHGKEVAHVGAVGEAKARDATGAGDLFASGFLYGLIKGLSLQECCQVGACSGGSVVRDLGGEVTPSNWLWMYKQMLSNGVSIPITPIPLTISSYETAES